MKRRLLLIICWVLSWDQLAAQSRAIGPWRVDASGESKRVPWTVNPRTITLFLNCENPLLVPVTPPAKQATLRFTATGATIRLDTDQHVLLLSPSRPVVVLWAYQGQKVVSRRTFKAVLPPAPRIKLFYGGPSASDYKPSPTHQFTLRPLALPELSFAKFLPDDARYRVARFRTTLLRHGKAVAPSSLWEERAIVADLTPGEELQVDILQVQRQNFRAEISEIAVKKRVLIPYETQEN
jgi:hypothetical protein